MSETGNLCQISGPRLCGSAALRNILEENCDGRKRREGSGDF